MSSGEKLEFELNYHVLQGWFDTDIVACRIDVQVFRVWRHSGRCN